MDGVIFEHFNFWFKLHKIYGTFGEGKKLTELYVKTNYKKLVEEVIGRLWKGKPKKDYMKLVKSIRYVKGAKETLQELKKRGYKIAIISSGPSDLAERAKKEAGIDYIYTNKLVFRNGKVLGTTEMKYWPIRQANKQVILRELCEKYLIDYKDCIVVVHEDNDIKMAKTAGIAIGFNPTSKELEKYCKFIIALTKLFPFLKKNSWCASTLVSTSEKTGSTL
jgi:phosphoserine phosphatase